MIGPPWSRQIDLKDVLQMVSRLVAEKPEEMERVDGIRRFRPGYTESELRAHEIRLGRKLPAELRQFYRACGGLNWSEGTKGQQYTDYIDRLAGVTLNDFTRMFDLRFALEEGRAEEAWEEAGLFAFGGDRCGSSLVYCENPPNLPKGAIILIEHDLETNPDNCIVVLGESLAQWLARFIACGCREYAVYMLELWELGEALETAYLEDVIRLNPRASWPRERRARIELSVLKRPDSGMFWDEDSAQLKSVDKLENSPDYLDLAQTRDGDLRALGECRPARRLEQLRLSYSRVASLSGIETFIGLKALEAEYTRIADLSPLTKLVNLERLDVSGTPVADIRPLGALSRLRHLSLRRTLVEDISPLVRASSLSYLFLSDAPVVDLKPLKGLRRLEHLEIDGTNVSDITPLAQVRSLRSLSLSRGKISQQHVAALKKRNSRLLVSAVSDGVSKTW